MANLIDERHNGPGNGPDGEPGDGSTEIPAERRLAHQTVATPATARPKQATMHRCPNCGAINRGHASICPECGESLRVKPRRIRCRHCAKSASSVLVICPHCGRELEEAPTRWALWAIPVIVLALALLLIAQSGAIRPIGWARGQIDAGLTLLNELGASMDPNVVTEGASIDEVNGDEVNGVATPALEPAVEEVGERAPDGAPPAADIAPESNEAGEQPPASAVAVAEANAVTEAPADDPAEPNAAAEEPSPTPTPSETVTAPPLPTETPSPTETATATTVATATATATQTATPTTEPTSTATQTTAVTTTRAAIGALVLLPSPTPTGSEAAPDGLATSPALAGSNSLTSTTTLRQPTATATNTASPTATVTPLPTPTPTEPPPTPTPVPPQLTYRVQSGDTLSRIATVHSVSIDALMAANGLSAQDAYSLRPGAELVIPTGDTTASNQTAPAATPTATVQPRTYTIQPGDTPIAIANRFGISVDALLAANGLTLDDARRLRTGQVLVIPGSGQTTTTTAPVAANPVAPSTAQQAIRLDAPQLRSPENGAQLSCNSGNSMAWLPVSFIQEDDQFLLHLGFVNSVNADGSENIVWVLEQVQGANNTLWSMDAGLCSLAPQEFGRKWYWYVEVVEQRNGARIRVSEPSQSWTFSWN